MSTQAVNHPNHYKREDVNFECYELSTAFEHTIACAIEYVFRHRAKNGTQDLEKAIWWIEHTPLNQIIQEPVKCQAHTIKQITELITTTNKTEQNFWTGIIMYIASHNYEERKGSLHWLKNTLQNLIKEETALAERN